MRIGGEAPRRRTHSRNRFKNHGLLRVTATSHVLYGRHNGRRFAVDVVGEVRRAEENGRALQDLLVQAGPCYVKALKRARAGAAKNQKS
jgi:hypothetical protein